LHATPSTSVGAEADIIVYYAISQNRWPNWRCRPPGAFQSLATIGGLEPVVDAW